MNDKITIEVTEQGLAELLSYAMTGIEEVGDTSPVLVDTFKELANKLPVTAYDAEVTKEFAANLSTTVDGADEDYSFTLESLYDEDDYQENNYVFSI